MTFRYDCNVTSLPGLAQRGKPAQKAGRLPAPLLAALLVVATVLAYLPALSAGFVWDDDEYLWKNPLIAGRAESAGTSGLESLRDIWIPRFTPFYGPATPQYYPVVFTSFWIEHRIYPADDGQYGTHPLGYHLINLLLHIGNALLIMALLRRIGVDPLIAWSIACIFAVHPVHVESVVWVTERKNLLSTFFYLLAALAYLQFDATRANISLHSDSPLPSDRRVAAETEALGVRENPRGPWPWYVLSLLLFALALLSKSVAASLPVAIMILLLLMRQRMSLARLWPLLPMLVMGAAAGFHTGYLEKHHVGALGPDWEFSIAERFLIASRALLFYPWKLLALTDLVFVYPRWTIDSRALVQWIPLLVEVVAGLFLLRLWWKDNLRWPLLACAFYAVTIFPALGFANIYPMRFSFVADHFQYLASIGIIALTVGILAQLLRRPHLVFGSVAVMTIALAILTFAQSRLYHDDITLYRATIERNPQAWMAHSNLARKYIDEAERARRRHDAPALAAAARQAEQHARFAAAIRPDNERPWINLAESLRLQNQLPEAIEAIQRGIDALEAERQWLSEHGHEQKVLWANYHLAIDHGSLAALHDAMRDAAAAIEAYTTALRIVPDDAGTVRLRLNLHTRLADLYTRQDRIADAAPHYEFVLSQHPDDFLSHLVLGEHARREGRYLEAQAHLRTALDVVNTPEEELQAMYRLGWLYATARDDRVRDGRSAAALGERMIQGTEGTSPDAFDLYAAALAELGRFNDAAKMAEEALKLTEAHELTELDAKIRQRLELYRQSRPYRE